MNPEFIIDENLPADVPLWNNERFIHVYEIDISTDTDIWNYALQRKLTIITKDADFYNRYLSIINCPKVIWIRTGNMRKRDFQTFIEECWKDAELMLQSSTFIIIDQEKMEGL